MLDRSRLPKHVAVIMDGNGRWARDRGLPRISGHRAGIEATRRVIEDCRSLGIKILTLFAFSVENWKRPKSEVSALMDLLKKYLRGETHKLIENDIRFKAIGRINGLSDSVQKEITMATQRTKNGKEMMLNVALNYSGRIEIIDAINKIIGDVQGGRLERDKITEEVFSRYLYTESLPDPDLLIRTSGEERISNFLLWQTAYAEFFVTSVYWPDFRRYHLLEALVDYQKRKRRFGGL
ncbi:MAG: isoprenyl transferase [bacterium]|nr:isoprenyl transferase [bacterium]